MKTAEEMKLYTADNPLYIMRTLRNILTYYVNDLVSFASPVFKHMKTEPFKSSPVIPQMSPVKVKRLKYENIFLFSIL